MAEKFTVVLGSVVSSVEKDKTYNIEVIAETECKDSSVEKAYEMMRSARRRVLSLQREVFH